MMLCVESQKKFQSHMVEALVVNERLKWELQTATKVIERETPLLSALTKKQPWLHEFCQQSFATIINLNLSHMMSV